jgi:hypothetical protein
MDNIEMNLTEIGSGHGLNSFGSEQREVTGSCEYGNEPSI